MNAASPILSDAQRRQLRILLGIPLLWVGLVCLVSVSLGRTQGWTIALAIGGFAAFAGGLILLADAARPHLRGR